MTDFDAIILAGGEGRRLGGVDKATLLIGGSTFLERSLMAVAAATRIICVGPVRSTSVLAIWTREEPVGSGPAAALGAGLALVEAPITMVLSVDAPLVTASIVERLVSACATGEAALLADEDLTPQMLIGAYPTEVLRGRLDVNKDLVGLPVRRLISGVPYTLLIEPEAARDCDTWEDVESVRREGR